MNKARLAITGTIILVLLIATFNFITVPSSAENIKNKKVEKFIEIAEKAGEKAENLLTLIQKRGINLDLTEVEEKLDEGKGKLENAKNLLEQGYLEDAIGNATEAFKIFREIFKTLHSMLGEAGVGIGKILNASGLIEAMKRALQRIERLRELIPEELQGKLDEAEEYLDIEVAMELLSQGKVNETAHRLAQANKLIAQVHKLLKGRAKQLNFNKIKCFIKVMEKFYSRLKRQVDKFGNDTLNEWLQEVFQYISDAKSAFEQGNYEDAISKFKEARNILEKVELGLRQLKRGHGRRP